MKISVSVDRADTDIVISGGCKNVTYKTSKINDLKIDAGFYPNLVINGDPLLEQRVLALENNKYVDTSNLNW